MEVPGGVGSIALLVVGVFAALWVLPPTRGVATLILEGIRGTLAALFTLPFRLSFTLVWVAAVLFLLFNAGSIYGDDAARQTTVLTIYLLSITFVFTQTGARNPLIGISVAEFVVTFVIFLAFAVATIKFIVPVEPTPAVLTAASVGVILTHALVVAIGEELIFRYGFPSLLPFLRPMVAQTISAVAFGFFHWQAYGGNLGSVTVAILMGLVFGAITVLYPRRGLIGVMGVHAGYNLTVLGFT